MAGQKELVATVAEALGVPIETVTVYDRFLAEAGMRTRAKRGRGSTPMTYRDAANLLIAAALQVQPKDTVSIVQEYNALPANGDAPAATFGDAFARLLEVFARDRHALQARADRGNRHYYEVMLRGPKPYAEIRVGNPKVRSVSSSFGADKNIALRNTVEFSEWAFMPIVDAIAADLPDIPPIPA